MNNKKYNSDEIFMHRCIELARQAEGLTFPNPMVGSVIVHNGKIIGEGFHQKQGSPHAEVNAINSVKDQSLLENSTLYVNLEPCSHHGKTPPCSLLIIQKKIKKVVIGCVDTFSEVSGKGIEMLKNAGIEVQVGILEEESRELNRRFFTFFEKNRPYIILKWAETTDGFIDYNREVVKDNRPTWISNAQSLRLVHKWRSREQAILVGSTTALKDNPSLTVRNWSGKNPLRIVIDRNNKLPNDLSLFDKNVETIMFTSNIKEDREITQVKIDNFDNPIPQIIEYLYKREIQSIIIEGGATILSQFISQNLWDEARIFVGNKKFIDGVKAPKLMIKPFNFVKLGNTKLLLYKNIK